MNTGARVLVIGLGNEVRGDDAAGLAVARRLCEIAGPGLKVVEASGDSGRLIETWSGFDAVILVDAMRSGAAPGTVRRVDAMAETVPAYFTHRSTHSIGVLDAVELARAMDRLPAQMVLYGIEGADYSAGAELSPEVQRAVADAAETIRDEAVRLARAPGATTRA